MDLLAEEFAYPIPFAKKSLVFLVFKLLLSLQVQKHSPDTTSRFQMEYDYIVVGAGPGGATVAARLSEIPCITILLLEAGQSAPLLTEVPVISRSYVGTDLDWGYKSTPQRFAGDSMINRRVVLPSAKAIGGSSIFNNLMYVRGSPIIYDQWEEMGATGWSYKGILPYFKKSEMNRNPESIDIPYHGFHGPMTVERPIYTSPLKSAIEAAMYELNHVPVDVNGRHFKGFYDFQANLRYGQRCSAAKAYLVPAENRRNLDIVKNAFVTKVIIEQKRAVGVQMDYFGKTYIVRARREVILSAGTVNTAQLLMLSGIGPKNHLRDMRIPVVADLPVGNNFHDHGGTHQMYYSDELLPFSEEVIDPQNIKRYIRYRSGILSVPTGRLYIAFFNNHEPSSPHTLPDYELLFQDTSAKSSMATSFNMRPEVYKQLYEPYENKSLLMCVAVAINPKSRGTVRLRSLNAYDSPLIDPNYLADPQDLSAIVGGMKGCDRITNTLSLHKVGVKPFATLLPGCEIYAEDQNEYYKCKAGSFVVSVSHLVGTARMGACNDSTTVVDPELRVKGIKGLRVVDASVMPKVPTGHTYTPTLMIAEKAADMIKGDIVCSW